MHQPTRSTATLGASAAVRMPSEPPTTPTTIHGRRIPSDSDVRSLILPKKGLATMDSSAPIEATSARLVGAWVIPTRALTFRASVTRMGARNSKLVAVKARAYSTSHVHPTRSVAGGLYSGETSPMGRLTTADCVMASPFHL